VTDNTKIVSTNRKAGFEYTLLERFEEGLELKGSEIKSIRVSESTDWYDVEGRYKIQGFGLSLAPGILMINDLKEREKFVIIAELAKRGR